MSQNVYAPNFQTRDTYECRVGKGGVMEHVQATILEQISEARGRIADMLLEIDDIVLQVNPQIQADYATKIGYLENDLLKWQIAARRSRRRFALAEPDER